MHLAIEHQALREVVPVGLQRAAVVVQPHPGHPRDQPVGGDRRQAAAEARARPSLGAPSAHQVVALGEFGQQARDVGRIVLAVAVDCDHHVAGGLMQSADERRGLSRVAREPEYPDVRVASLDRAQDVDAAVGRAVVDEQHLVRHGGRAEHAREFLVQRSQVVPLVVERNNYREFHRVYCESVSSMKAR